MKNSNQVLLFLNYVKSGNISAVKEMLKDGFILGESENGGNSGLILAADAGNKEMVELLLRAGGM